MNEILIPPKLKAGDKVALVATARKISLEEIKPAIDIIESWGLTVTVGNTIGKENFQ